MPEHLPARGQAAGSFSSLIPRFSLAVSHVPSAQPLKIEVAGKLLLSDEAHKPEGWLQVQPPAIRSQRQALADPG